MKDSIKVFVVTSHSEFNDEAPETYVEGVFDTKDKAKKVVDELFEKILKQPNWAELEDDEKVCSETENYRDILNLNDNCEYTKIEIWEREIE